MASDGEQGGHPPPRRDAAGAADHDAPAAPGDGAPGAGQADADQAQAADPAKGIAGQEGQVASAADAGGFEPAPLDETLATEAVVDRRRLQRRVHRSRRRGYVVVHRAGAGPARVEMDRPVLSFGRDADECDIVLEGAGVSRRHALIERSKSGYFTLVDCKSRNGTFVDGQPVTTMNLVDGDTFEIGEHRIAFHIKER